MTLPEKNLLDSYYQLRDEIDKLRESLEEEHYHHLSCKKGCDHCCMSINVFPIEFFAIQAEVDPGIVSDLPLPTNEVDCRYLVDHSCKIYKSRPIICRTHGLPLLYMNFEGTNWELSHCENNFTDVDLDDFNSENTFPLDRINSKLYQINHDFVATFENGKYTEIDRIPLSGLFLSAEIAE